MYRSPRSYNSQVGVPLSLLGIDPKTEIAIIEAGISQKGEMQHLQQMIQPTIGIFTHLGDAHGENFASREEKLAEKSTTIHVLPMGDRANRRGAGIYQNTSTFYHLVSSLGGRPEG